MARFGFVFDQKRCLGCSTCQMACKDKNNLEKGLFFRRVVTIETEENGRLYCENYSGACNHCANAACVNACPTGAMHYREDHTVGHDKSRCIGCGMCVLACPYKAVSLSHKHGTAAKCDSCVDLRSKGKNPACVDACLAHCLKFMDIEEIQGDYVNERSYLPKASITDPSLVIYAKRGERD